MRGVLFLDEVFEAKVGFSPQERAKGQEVRIRADVAVDVSKAGESDALPDTVDLDLVRKIIEDSLREEYKLIESLAVKLLDNIFAMDGRVDSVAIEVEKLETHTGIRVERNR
jgi:dihydroneopterin aldolase